MQAHTDVVVYENVLTHLDTENTHKTELHKNDSDDDKNTDHHHHCTVVNFSLTFIPTEILYNFRTITTQNREMSFYQNSYYSSYLSGIFQPPRV